MRRSLLSLLILVSLTIAAPLSTRAAPQTQDPLPPNLVVNASFEEGVYDPNGMPEGWTKTVTSGAAQLIGLGISGTHDWTYINCSWPIRPTPRSNPLTFILGLSPGATGTVWFDDVRLELYPANQDSLLVNGDAEQGTSTFPAALLDWTPASMIPNAATFGWDSAEVYSGTKSLKISATTPNDA